MPSRGVSDVSSDSETRRETRSEPGAELTRAGSENRPSPNSPVCKERVDPENRGRLATAIGTSRGHASEPSGLNREQSEFLSSACGSGRAARQNRD